MTRQPAPPTLAERLLFATIPDGDWRESIAGDLREEFAVLSQRRGARAARRWYWRQTLAIGTRAVVSRVGGNPMPRRNWISLPELDERARWGAGLTRDLAYALRSVLRRPGTSAVVVVTLALALAANATIFGVMDALVWRPYRFAEADRTVLIASSAPQESTIDRESVAPGDFADWRREVTGIQHLSAAEWWDANLSGIETPEQIAGFHVTADFFRVFGAAPAIGRGFLREEETRGAHRRVVIAHTLWVRRFASDPAIVGRAIRVDGEPHEVVGVAPQGFSIPLGAEMWAPLANTSQTWTDRRSGNLYVVGRLAEGETMDTARAEVTAIVARQQREYPDTNAKRDVTVTDFTHGMADPGAGPFLSTWQVASLLLLVIACANVANLLLARGAERAQEFAVRLALGAGRGRLASQLVIEGALLSAAATLIAVPLAAIGLGLSRASIPASVIRFIPGWPYMRLSVEVLAATAVLATIATLLFSLVPALHAARAGAADILRQDTRSVTRKRTHLGRTALAALQVALTLALLFGSVLVLSAVHEAANGALGFDKHQLLVARMVLPAGPYAQLGARTHFVDTVLERLRAVPAVSHVAAVSHLPYGGSSQSREFRPEGGDLAPADVRRVAFRTATPSYFETMRIPLLAGRTFAETDTTEAQAVAIVSKSLAARYWPDVDPIGRRFRLEQDSLLIAVVGVVGDIAQDVDTRGNPMLYRPSRQAQIRPLAIVVRTVGDPLSIAGELRRAVAAADRDQPLIELKPMADLIEDRVAGVTFVGRALSTIAVIAFVLAMTGLYSLIAYLTSRRTREIGVRVALGARRWQVIRVTTVQALQITTVGIALGIGLSAAVGRVMESTLLGIVSTDWLQLAGLSTLLAGVALVAAYLPARRAASIDPTTALRAD